MLIVLGQLYNRVAFVYHMSWERYIYSWKRRAKGCLEYKKVHFSFFNLFRRLSRKLKSPYRRSGKTDYAQRRLTTMKARNKIRWALNWYLLWPLGSHFLHFSRDTLMVSAALLKHFRKKACGLKFFQSLSIKSKAIIIHLI